MVRRGFHAGSLAVLLSLILTGCDGETIGTPSHVTTPVQVPSFTRLDVGSAFVVSLSIGPARVTLDVSENVLEHVDVHVSGGTLHVGLESGTTLQAGTAILQAAVSAPRLTAVTVAGASVLSWRDSLATASLTVSVSGNSSIQGPIETDQTRVELSGASHLALRGAAHSLDARVSGASDASILGLKVNDLTVTLSGASHMETTVVDTISADLSGASSLVYAETYGQPTFTHKEVSGASSIQAGP